MARGDPVFMRLDIDKILNGERISPLSGDRFKVYIVLRALCIKCRTDVLPEEISRPKYAEGRANLGPRKGKESISSILQHLSKEPIKLIAICPHNGRIKVLEVIENNPKLHFDRAVNNCPHMGTCTGKDSFPIWGCKKGGESERLRDKEKGSDSDTEIVTQRDLPDVGKLLEEAEKESDQKREVKRIPEGAPEDGQTARLPEPGGSSEPSQDEEADQEPWNKIAREEASRNA